MKSWSRRQFASRALVGCASLRMFGSRVMAAEPAGACRQLAGQTVTWIIPNAPGTGYDLNSRLVEPYLEKMLGAQFVLRNMTGAGGVIGARRVMTAPPDGRTLGLINASGLLATWLAGDKSVPNPLKDFAVLGRMVANRQVIAAGSNAGLRTLNDLLVLGRKRPVVIGISDVGSSGFIASTITAHLLDLPIEIVPGYAGPPAGVLAVLRGDVDAVIYTVDSIRPQLDARELTPLLQMGAISSAGMSQVPLLGGPDGMAVRHARDQKTDAAIAEAMAAALNGLLEAGRLIVGPSRLAADVAACLERTIAAVLGDAAFLTRAAQVGQTIEAASGQEMRLILASAANAFDRFANLIADAIKKVRR